MRRIFFAFLPYGDVLHVLGARDGAIESLAPIGCFTPDWNAVRAAGEGIEALCAHASESGELGSSTLSELRRLGGYLFDELFPPAAKRWLVDTPRGELLLSLAPELLPIPWELAHTGSDFLCRSWAMGRLIQGVDARLRAAPATAPKAPSVLIIADPDGELHESYHEGMRLRERLVHRSVARVDLRAADVDAAFLRRHLRDYELLHFAGHIDDRGWRMADSALDADQVARLQAGSEPPLLVFANGCGAVRSHGERGRLLRAWLDTGVRHVLGPLFDLPDRLGRAFALAFWDELVTGATVGESVRAARDRIAAELGEGTLPWGAYVLYGEPGATCFPPAGARAELHPTPVPSTPLTTTRLSPWPESRPEVVRSHGLSASAPVTPSRAPTIPLSGFVAVILALIATTALLALLPRMEPPSAQLDAMGLHSSR